MLTYAPPSKKISPKTYEKPWLLILLAFVWLCSSLISHDLWNPNEPYIYTAIQYISTTKNFILPKIYYSPYIDNSPFYLYIGLFFQKIFYPWAMSKYTAIRLATIFFMVVSLTFSCLAGSHLLGRRNGRSVGLILLCCPGITIFGHLMGVLPVLLASYSIFIYAVAVNAQNTLLSGFFIGLSLILSFLAFNLLPIIILGIILLFLPINTYWRNKKYLISIILALLIAIPIILLWPYALLENSYINFQLWMKYSLFSSFGGINNFHYGFGLKKYFTNIIWYAFPAWILVIFTIIKEKNQFFKNRTYFLCSIWIIIASILMIFASEFDANDLIHIIIPIVILAADKLDYLQRSLTAFFNWLGITIFGTCAISIFALFCMLNYHFPRFLSQKIYKINDFYITKINYFSLIIAIIFLIIWFITITRKNVTGRKAITNWSVGMTLIWTLILTLLLPLVNSIKSHRYLVISMFESLPDKLIEQFSNSSQCINSNNQIVLITWNEYGKIPIYNNNHRCNYLIKLITGAHDNNIKNANNGEIIWQSYRPTKKNENYILLKNK